MTGSGPTSPYKRPPNEDDLGRFDLSKMSIEEVAAELARRSGGLGAAATESVPPEKSVQQGRAPADSRSANNVSGEGFSPAGAMAPAASHVAEIPAVISDMPSKAAPREKVIARAHVAVAGSQPAVARP